MLTAIKREVRRVIFKLSGEYSYLNPTVRCRHAWYGNSYGGFYACPDLLNANSIVYSFGIGEDTSFDEAIISRHGCDVFAFDPTPKSIAWVTRQSLPERFHFSGVGISDRTGFADFYLPKNPLHVSGSVVEQENVNLMERITVHMKSIGDIAKELGHNAIDVLKMDIEGAEYDVIQDLVNVPIPIRQILIEFHGRFVKDGSAKTQRAVGTLRSRGYEVFACSKTYQEVSFIRKGSA